MTVSSETARNAVVGDGTTGPYTMGITVAAEGDFLVTQVVTSSGAETPLTLTTDYTVNSDLTEVTTVTAVPATEKLVFTRSLTLTQGTDYLANNAFPADTTETALDRLTYINQQQQEELARVVKFPVGTGITLPVEITGDPLDDQAMIWDTATGKFTWQTLGTGAFLGNELVGDLDCNGYQVQWSKGADVASAGALAVLTDGNYFDVTGTTTVTSINTTGGAGTLIKLHFDGILTLTHHATNLILPGGANITTAAGDEAEFIEYGAGTYRCTNYTRADGTSLAQADVAVSELADGTDGELITWDSSGEPTTVAVGTSGHVLTSNGAGAEPTFQAAGGGAWTLVETQVASTSSSIEFSTISSDYDSFVIIGESIYNSAEGVMHLQISNSSTYVTTAYNTHRMSVAESNASYSGNVDTNAAGIQVGYAQNALANSYSFRVQLNDLTNSGTAPLLFGEWGVIYSGTDTLGGQIVGSHNTAQAIDGIKILPASGTITAGRFTLYGISHS